MRRAAMILGVVVLGTGGGALALRGDDDGGGRGRGNDTRSSAVEAVTRFLQSEIDGDFERSFALLAEDERRDVGSVSSWRVRRAEQPRYIGFELGPQEDGAGVDTVVRFDPRLDEVAGMVPARARVRWVTEKEDDGFRVSLSRSKLEPIVPDESKATAAALSWVAQRQACSSQPSYDGNLLGQPQLATELCGKKGAFRATGVGRLDESPVAPAIVNAFGSGSTQWSRVVHLEGPDPIDVVTAPLGERWVAVGVVAR